MKLEACLKSSQSESRGVLSVFEVLVSIISRKNPYKHVSNCKRLPRQSLTFRGLRIVSIFVLIYFQRDATLHSLFISGKLLYMFRVVSSPIIRSTYNCIYSIWYLFTIIAICLYCGRVGAGLSVMWELCRSVTYVGWYLHPSSGAHITVFTVSGTC